MCARCVLPSLLYVLCPASSVSHSYALLIYPFIADRVLQLGPTTCFLSIPLAVPVCILALGTGRRGHVYLCTYKCSAISLFLADCAYTFCQLIRTDIHHNFHYFTFSNSQKPETHLIALIRHDNSIYYHQQHNNCSSRYIAVFAPIGICYEKLFSLAMH